MPKEGLEPSLPLRELDFESSASANSATSATVFPSQLGLSDLAAQDSSRAPTPLWKTPTPQRRSTKPRRNYQRFPRQIGQWEKTVRGKLDDLRTWDHPYSAECKYLYEREYLQAGRLPPTPDPIGCRLFDLCTSFFTSKQCLQDTGEVTNVTFFNDRPGTGDAERNSHLAEVISDQHG